ncbi:MAG: lipid A biosynthesis acyltransferase [Alloprevotella sp.]
MEEKKNWKGTTYGNGWMHSSLIFMLKYINVRIIYSFVAIFVVPVCMIVNPGRRVIYKYYRERWSCSPLKSFLKTYQNFYLFGQVVVDKFAMYAGKKFEVTIDGYDEFTKLASRERGFVQLSAHIGNYEIAGYTLRAETKRFNALVYSGEKDSIMENRNRMFENSNITMIGIKSDMSHMFAINNALYNGEIVSMPADRLFGSTKCVSHTFLRATAKFPYGPFAVATSRSADVLAVNVMKVSTRRYHIYVTPLKYDKEASRKDQIEQLSHAYVQEVERLLKKYPEQWYNYYDFWS